MHFCQVSQTLQLLIGINDVTVRANEEMSSASTKRTKETEHELASEDRVGGDLRPKGGRK